MRPRVAPAQSPRPGRSPSATVSVLLPGFIPLARLCQVRDRKWALRQNTTAGARPHPGKLLLDACRDIVDRLEMRRNEICVAQPVRMHTDAVRFLDPRLELEHPLVGPRGLRGPDRLGRDAS